MFLFRGEADRVAAARVQRRHERRARRLQPDLGHGRAVHDGPHAALERAQEREGGRGSAGRERRRRSRALRVGLSAGDGARRRAGVHLRGRGGRGQGRDRVGAVRAAARARDRRLGRRPRARRDRPRPDRGASSATCRRRSSTSRSGWPTTTARRRRARSRSSAPETPKRRKVQAPPAERQALVGRGRAGRAVGRAATPRSSGSWPAIDAGGGAFLLYGATGSGKTEVYLQACAAALERGLGAIVLVPEIALAPQTVGRVRARFGDRVAILHSGLTDAERRDERERIASGEARIVVGARSAVFAPVRGLGLIVVDEEHDASYKQDSDPRYDARTLAAKRAALEGAVAVYGSATPRPESWERLERLELGGRVTGSLPPVQIVDLRREAGYPLSAPLLRELRGVADRSGKAILLLNRRGVAPALHCRACGTTIRCPNCDVALVLHRDGGLRCHHCGHAEPSPGECPSVRLDRARAPRRRHAEARARARARVPRAGADPPRRGHRVEAGGADRRAAPLRRDGRRGAARHADGREGPPLRRRRAGGGDRRRHVARACPTSAPRSARSS